jgi:hypothetical protein
MKVSGIVWFANLVLAGMLAGNEFGTWAAWVDRSEEWRR